MQKPKHIEAAKATGSERETDPGTGDIDNMQKKSKPILAKAKYPENKVFEKRNPPNMVPDA
jgi:hypothetical protein